MFVLALMKRNSLLISTGGVLSYNYIIDVERGLIKNKKKKGLVWELELRRTRGFGTALRITVDQLSNFDIYFIMQFVGVISLSSNWLFKLSYSVFEI